MSEHNTEDETEQKIVNKVQKVITIKRNLSEKQKSHLETLASKRKGKVYKEVVKQEEVPEVKITKKPRSKKVVEVVESESEEESSEEEIIVKKKVKKIPDQEIKAVKKAVKIPDFVPKKKAVKKVVPTPVVVENSSSFRSKLF